MEAPVSEETRHISTETLPPEGYLEPRRYKVAFCCERCGKEFSRIYKSVPKKDPPCPNPKCVEAYVIAEQQKEITNLKAMLESGKAPAHLGANNTVRAVDTTAEIVMSDYGMTNLKDNIRDGESVAPSLPPAQQKAADNYFGGGNGNVRVPSLIPGQAPRTVQASHLNNLGRRAMAGAFRHNSVSPLAVVPDAARGQSPLTIVRTEPLQKR
jgi:hypothetical protein